MPRIATSVDVLRAGRQILATQKASATNEKKEIEIKVEEVSLE